MKRFKEPKMNTSHLYFIGVNFTFVVVATFMDIVQKLHGNSKIIVSDRDTIFTGKFWTELFSCLGT